ncbi:hypothetical protein [Lamprobacter modestohalophilus]|uniref:hypothetical protein n=1 Tax=Lamprobacter modestohalophilus TaxID=1064514 RepID=UPI0019069C9E|nr:hypothetical protein [Lamprobacter modestohalophilus]
MAMRANEIHGVGGMKKKALFGSDFSNTANVRTMGSVLKALFAEPSALMPPPTARLKPMNKAMRAVLIPDAEGYNGEQIRLIFAWLQQQNTLRKPGGAHPAVMLFYGQH